ncbi:hypothetical protein BBO99_00005406 [Phytophthora kernoviae]|uniref:Glycosyl transferase family 1 domain-containing protein n=1 Tax=Phytophthora kernoviae TaxID=325452 RepID=A0A3R7IM43_9STRA|nr:hypothetical protein JM16_005972 [Phytophthora kernoviae]RLN36861.1 hypothetical protein BBI17_006245 [Phytophthora kernoviae]RLN79261.1 hypothetical protein BBO99_00005406 [Phytophthora kernoviae]
MLALWSIATELTLVTPDGNYLNSELQRVLVVAEAAAEFLQNVLESRMLPRWVLEVKFEDKARNRSVTYHDLCPNTPMIFFNHYWEDLLDAPDWPAAKPLYLMPNVEMYELESEHYWRADVVLCKTAVCARYLRQWFEEEGNPRSTRVLYSRHTTSNLALTVRDAMSAHESAALSKKNFSDVSFLHTVGTSIQKGTRQVLDCWFSRSDLPRLDLYINQELYDGAFKDYDGHIANSTNIIVYTGCLMPGEFGHVIAEGRYFLCPSVVEGYGHYINQARSANAFIVTTDAAPMNELITPSSGAIVRTNVGAYNEQFLGGLSPVEYALHNVSGLVAGFSPDNLCEAVLDVVGNTTPEEREHRADKALQQYYFDTVFFAQKMRELWQFARTQSHPSRHHFLRRALEI